MMHEEVVAIPRQYRLRFNSEYSEKRVTQREKPLNREEMKRRRVFITCSDLCERRTYVSIDIMNLEDNFWR